MAQSKNQFYLRIVNVVLAGTFLIQAIGGLAYILDIYYDNQYQMHQISGLIMIVAAAIHLFLNRTWVKNTYFKRSKKG